MGENGGFGLPSPPSLIGMAVELTSAAWLAIVENAETPSGRRVEEGVSRRSWTSEARKVGPSGIRRAMQLLDQQVAALAAVDPDQPVTKSADKPYRERRMALGGLLRGLGLQDPLPFSNLEAWQQRARKHSPAGREPLLRRWARPTYEHLASLLADKEPAANAWTAMAARLDDAQRLADREPAPRQLRTAGRICLEVLEEAAALAPDADRRLVGRAQALARTPMQTRNPTPAHVERAVQAARDALTALQAHNAGIMIIDPASSGV